MESTSASGVLKKILIVIVLILLLGVLVCCKSMRARDFLVSVAVNIRRDHFYGPKYFQQNFFKLYPQHKNISSHDFPSYVNVNCNRSRKNEFCIKNMPELMPNFENVLHRKGSAKEELTEILKSLLKHVHLNGKPVSIDDCVVLDLLTPTGAYFPALHTDIEWGVFDKSDGFQIWYLIENDKPHGNMFVLQTDQVEPSTNLQYKPDGAVFMQNQCGNGVIKQVHPSIYADPIFYLNMKPGECFFMNKNVYHMSDVRNNPSRQALNFRVIIRDNDGGVPVNFEKACAYNFFMNVVRARGIRRGNKIYPTTFGLMEMFG